MKVNLIKFAFTSLAIQMAFCVQAADVAWSGPIDSVPDLLSAYARSQSPRAKSDDVYLSGVLMGIVGTTLDTRVLCGTYGLTNAAAIQSVKEFYDKNYDAVKTKIPNMPAAHFIGLAISLSYPCPEPVPSKK